MVAGPLELTLGAEALEGWQPLPRHLDSLRALLGGAATFGQYLAPYLAEEKAAHPPARTRFLARSRPYLIRGTTVLRNNLGVTDTGALQRLEFVATAGRIALLLAQPGRLPPDPLAVHQELFADVYPWAGQPRIVELRKGGSAFTPVDDLDRELAHLRDHAATITAHHLPRERLAYELARWYARYNSAHPFREGNGRAGVAVMQLVAARHGRHLRVDTVTRADWVRASIEAMPFRRGGDPDHRPVLAVLLGIIEDNREGCHT